MIKNYFKINLNVIPHSQMIASLVDFFLCSRSKRLKVQLHFSKRYIQFNLDFIALQKIIKI